MLCVHCERTIVRCAKHDQHVKLFMRTKQGCEGYVHVAAEGERYLNARCTSQVNSPHARMKEGEAPS